MSDGLSSSADRILTLLGQGVAAEMVAAAVGVSVSYVSQLLSTKEFADRVSELRYAHLSKHNERDNRYDSLEDKLLHKMEGMIGMMFKPIEVLKSLQVINQAKRRGVSAPENIAGTRETVSLNIPVLVLNNFSSQVTTNIHNQVVKVGEQDLVTVQSVRMNDMLASVRVAAIEKREQADKKATQILEGIRNVSAPHDTIDEGTVINGA